MTIWIELCNISHTFKQQCITMLTGSCNQLIQLAFTCQHICITLIRGEVDSESYELFADYWLWTVND
jgi:hypothetical protein